MTFELKLWHETSDDINHLPEKTRRIIKTALKRLEEDPFPGRHGDKEKLALRRGVIIYRMHISHRYTVFYDIDIDEKLVLVQEILTTEQAHKKYGYYSG
ncbi:MAG: type II toxin-antitoxin system RelE/ParE family toxin [Methanoregula sp.]|nr:type II toxin-antitoxin system RelE/ParE family toxin [Methanoregula sp.]